MTANPEDTITVRVILPSGVKEIRGRRDFVTEEVHRLIFLESDLGESYAEVIPNPVTPIQQDSLPIGDNTNDNTADTIY